MNPFGVFKKLNPVTPVKKGIAVVEKKIATQLVLMLLRHALTAAGFASTLTDDDLSQFVGTLMLFAGIFWSAVRKIQAARAKPETKSE